MSLESAEQLREVRDVIADAFPPADLEMLVMDHLGVPLANLASPGPHPQRVFELLQACEARGWLERLLDGVAEERQQNTEVALLMQRMGRPTTSSMEAGVAVAAGGARNVSAAATGPPDVAAHVLSKRRDEELQALVKQLDDAYARQKRNEDIRESTAEIAREILDLKRRLREGGHLRAGDRLGGDGRYQLIQQVGRGGFAVVWKAKDRRDDVYVAIKVLHANLSGDSHRRERFFRGARMMQRLDHPAVVHVLDPYCEDGGFWYFVMEFVPNGTLHDAVLCKRLTRNDALRHVIRVGEALAKAHAQGIVHRDIKPANILLDEQSNAKLTDFDLVGAGDTTGGTRTSAMGTVIYAAPECLEKPQEATAQADVFGLGMTAVFALTGQTLTLSTLRNPEPTIARLDCSTEVKNVLRRAVVWEPEERFADAGEMVAALKESIDGQKLGAAAKLAKLEQVLRDARRQEKEARAWAHRTAQGRRRSLRAMHAANLRIETANMPLEDLAQLLQDAHELEERAAQEGLEEKDRAHAALESATRVREERERELAEFQQRSMGETTVPSQSGPHNVAHISARVPVSIPSLPALESEDALASVERAPRELFAELPAPYAPADAEATEQVELATSQQPTMPLGVSNAALMIGQTPPQSYRTMAAIIDTDPGQAVEAATAPAATAMTAPASYAKLVVLSPDLAGKEFVLSRRQVTMGRTEVNDVAARQERSRPRLSNRVHLSRGWAVTIAVALVVAVLAVYRATSLYGSHAGVQPETSWKSELPTTCDEPVETRLKGLAGRCQAAASARSPGAADLCLASYMMTRDPVTGARAARAMQARRGAVSVIEWIAGAVGDSPAGADAWVATGLARCFHDDARGALAALQRAAAHRAGSDSLGRLRDAVALVHYYQHEGDYQDALAPLITAYDVVDHVCSQDDRATAYLNIAGLLIDLGNIAMTEQVLDRARPLAPPTSRYYAYRRKLDAQIEKARDFPAQTEAALRDARAFAIRDGNSLLEFNTRMDLIQIALRNGALDKAAALLGAPPAADAPADNLAVDAYCRSWLADERGDHPAAVDLVEHALVSAPPSWTTRLEDVHGRALLHAGEPQRAEQALNRAVDEVERRRDAIQLDTLKSWMLAEQRESFEDLFLLYVSDGRLQDALSVAQRATARSTLDGLLSDQPPADGIAAVGQRSETLRKLARALRASRVSVVPPIATVLKRLRGNHVVTYFRARRELWAIAAARDSALTARRIGDPTAIAARISALHHDSENLTIADELGAMLLPDELMPPRDTPLYIVTDDPVSSLAFAALRRHGAFVIDQHPLAYASSAAVLAAMRRTQSPIRALVLGDPTDDLPQAREEAKEVAARLQVAPRLGADATRAAMLGASGATLIHVAAHTDGSALRFSDGLLDASVVIEHGITAGAIVLLPRSSAAITSPDELAPLPAAFVAAGAHTVVASRWSVEDQIGRDFAHLFYQGNGVVDPVQAVATAQRQLASRGVPIAQWSTFAVIGGLP